jgi:hypothetical protein
MATYRVPTFDLDARIQVTLKLLDPLRPWGLVSELAATYGVSRTTLYTLQTRAQTALTETLLAQPAGRPAEARTVTVDKALIDRFITVLPLTPGSVRGIQAGLALMLGVSRSLGYISQTLTAAGAQATALNLQLNVPLPVLGEADEIFQGRQPCLTVVDGRSFLALNLTPTTARDGDTWGVTLLDLQARGIRFQDLATDQGSGLLAGVRAAQLTISLRPDLFHLLDEGHDLTQQLERRAYRAFATAERARRATAEAQAPVRRRGRPLQLTTPLAQATDEEAQALNQLAAWTWLFGEIRQALEPLTPVGQLVNVAAAQTTIQTALTLLRELGQAELTAFAAKLEQHLPALLAPLSELTQQLAAVRQGLDTTTESFIGWAWQHRQALALNIERDFPAQLQPIVRSFWTALALFHRASSLAESLHSWLRPYLVMHRGMPQWLLPLLQLFWNHHEFARGKRAGHSPVELAGVANAPSLREILAQLLQPAGRPA